MDMTFFNPVNIITGKDCIKNNASLFENFGKRCLIVTGKSSAKKSGALDDVISVLELSEIAYDIFDKTEQNPSFETCAKAAEIAAKSGAEFIIGIGGGSPLDAAKAIAALATNKGSSAEVMYASKWENPPLPIIAVGTTAGTGSEVTPVAVITTPAGQKQSFRAPTLYPSVCFGDATYTMSLSAHFTRSTALDALAHCLESYFNKTANDISRTYALRGTAILVEMLKKTAICDQTPLSFDDREKLYCASLYGGFAISVTGTAFPHAMGYFLSEQYDICHGNACACYLEEFINYNASVEPQETEKFFDALKTDKDSLVNLIKQNLPKLDVKLTEEKIKELSPRFADNKSFKKTYGNVDEAFAVNILNKLFR